MSTERLSAIADAGLRLIAREGLRGLTHRAVDAEAGLPVGSTSYYFRKRDDLVTACVRRLVEIDLLEIAATGIADRVMTAEQLADMGADLMWHWITVDAHRHLARYELLLHSRRRPELAAELVDAGDRLRVAIAAMLQAQNCAQPASTAAWFVSCIDGVVLDQLTGPGQRRMSRSDLRAFATALVRAALADPDDS
ncbi:TetR family transcriptional regulator [Micromonospora purpureochromogenes]|uniref:TetR/AcrR family transcriptional regulator n=1 Tax=Micromonospora purpureochromogenes TaxID=47872 RepID=UPI00340E753D